MSKEKFVVKEEVLDLIKKEVKPEISSEVTKVLGILYGNIDTLDTYDKNGDLICSELCSCYEEKTRKRYLFNRFTGKADGYIDEIYGVCNGTRECDEVGCKGNRKSKECYYYNEK